MASASGDPDRGIALGRRALDLAERGRRSALTATLCPPLRHAPARAHRPRPGGPRRQLPGGRAARRAAHHGRRRRGRRSSTPACCAGSTCGTRRGRAPRPPWTIIDGLDPDDADVIGARADALITLADVRRAGGRSPSTRGSGGPKRSHSPGGPPTWASSCARSTASACRCSTRAGSPRPARRSRRASGGRTRPASRGAATGSICGSPTSSPSSCGATGMPPRRPRRSRASRCRPRSRAGSRRPGCSPRSAGASWSSRAGAPPSCAIRTRPTSRSSCCSGRRARRRRCGAATGATAVQRVDDALARLDELFPHQLGGIMLAALGVAAHAEIATRDPAARERELAAAQALVARAEETAEKGAPRACTLGPEGVAWLHRARAELTRFTGQDPAAWCTVIEAFALRVARGRARAATARPTPACAAPRRCWPAGPRTVRWSRICAPRRRWPHASAPTPLAAAVAAMAVRAGVRLDDAAAPVAPRARRAHPAGAVGARAGRRRAHQPPGRGRALHQREDGERAPVAGDGQAGREQPHRGRHHRLRPWPARSPRPAGRQPRSGGCAHGPAARPVGPRALLDRADRRARRRVRRACASASRCRSSPEPTFGLLPPGPGYWALTRLRRRRRGQPHPEGLHLGGGRHQHHRPAAGVPGVLRVDDQPGRSAARAAAAHRLARLHPEAARRAHRGGAAHGVEDRRRRPRPRRVRRRHGHLGPAPVEDRLRHDGRAGEPVRLRVRQDQHHPRRERPGVRAGDGRTSSWPCCRRATSWPS